MARYGKAAGKSVEKAMHKEKRGKLKSGKGGKGGVVKSRKQAIAISLRSTQERRKSAKEKIKLIGFGGKPPQFDDSIIGGASSGPFDIFTVGISLSAPSGILGPNFFSILGGADPSSFDTIGGAQFGVNVQSTTPVPEPASGALLMCGFIFLMATQRKKIGRLVQANW